MHAKNEQAIQADAPRWILPAACAPVRKTRSLAAYRESKSLALRIPILARVPARGQERDLSGTFASISGCAGDRAVCKRHPAANSARLRSRGGGQHQGLGQRF
jgi:hypothetical protein